MPDTVIVKITRKNYNKTIDVPVTGDRGKVTLGRVVFPGGVFPIGAVITISGREEDDQFSQRDPDSDCDGVRQDASRLSPAVDINVEHGPNSDFDRPVKVQLLSVVHPEACMAYSPSDERNYQCLPDETHSTKGQDTLITMVASETDHFTSFGVFFIGSARGCASGWVWPASVALVAASLVAMLLGFLYAVFKPNKEDKKLETIKSRVASYGSS